ncbi:MAG: hypothetical protein ABIJ34_09370 [archaeon]
MAGTTGTYKKNVPLSTYILSGAAVVVIGVSTFFGDDIIAYAQKAWANTFTKPGGYTQQTNQAPASSNSGKREDQPSSYTEKKPDTIAATDEAASPLETAVGGGGDPPVNGLGSLLDLINTTKGFSKGNSYYQISFLTLFPYNDVSISINGQPITTLGGAPGYVPLDKKEGKYTSISILVDKSYYGTDINLELNLDGTTAQGTVPIPDPNATKTNADGTTDSTDPTTDTGDIEDHGNITE